MFTSLENTPEYSQVTNIFKSSPLYSQVNEGMRVRIKNDYDRQDSVLVTLWTPERQKKLGTWTVPRGESVYLGMNGTTLRITGDYKIKVGEEWGWVNIGDVAVQHGTTWVTTVRKIYQATHANDKVIQPN